MTANIKRPKVNGLLIKQKKPVLDGPGHNLWSKTPRGPLGEPLDDLFGASTSEILNKLLVSV